MNKPYEIAKQELGQEEIKGSRHNPRIIEYSKTIGQSWVIDDETAWCASFVGYCLNKGGQISTRKLNARSYLKWGKKTTTPKEGDLVVFWRGSKWGWQGHVGFYVSQDATDIRVLGGNQSDKVKIAPYPKSRLLGYREVPNIEATPNVVKAKQLLEEAIKLL